MTIAEQLIKEGMEKGIQEGMEKGMQKGMEKGILEGKREAAKNLFKLGLTEEQVSKATELSIKEIAQIKKEIEN